MTTFGVHSSLRSDAARRIEESARRLQAERQHSLPTPMPPVATEPGGRAGGEQATASTPVVERRAGVCRQIIEEVAAKHDVSVRDILSERRSRVVIPARHESMYRCVAESSLSLPAIGRIFHRDHTSIGYGVMRHHLTTGDPLPRGMDWKSGRRKRR